MIKYIDGCEIFKFMVSWFDLRPASKRWFWKIIQVTMKHDPI
jgi:hypothetical protein